MHTVGRVQDGKHAVIVGTCYLFTHVLVLVAHVAKKRAKHVVGSPVVVADFAESRAMLTLRE